MLNFIKYASLLMNSIVGVPFRCYKVLLVSSYFVGQSC